MQNLDLKALEELLLELKTVLEEIKAASHKPSLDLGVFFDSVRKSLFNNRLTTSQVSGMEAKIKAFQDASFPLSHAAYALATSFHETAKRMQPVREGLNATDTWRRKNLRYYPYYGRGDVQLTWLENYQRADRELGLQGALVSNLDLALDPDVSAKIMVRGMTEGWFTKKSLKDYLPNDKGSKTQFKNARRIINGTDKADMIAEYALKFQTALEAAGWVSR